MRKGFVLPLILTVVVIGLVAVGAIAYFQLKPKPSPQTQLPEVTQPTTSSVPTPTDETANWKVFKNQFYKFELRYPPNWFADDKFDNTRLEIKDALGLQRILLISINEPKLGGDWCLGTSDIRKESVTINGIQGESYYCYFEDKNTPETIVMYFPDVRGGKTYYLEADVKSEYKLIDNILSTFRFLD